MEEAFPEPDTFRLHQGRELKHSIDQALLILPSQADEDVVIAPPGPIPSGHRAEEDHKLQLLATPVQQMPQKALQFFNLRAIR